MDLQARELDRRSRAGPTRRPLARRLGTRVLALLLGCVTAFVGAELGLRHLLFGSSVPAQRMGKSLRQELLYVPSSSDEDYWKLQVLLDRSVQLWPPNPDPLLGWTGSVQPRTYRHPDQARLRGRRPVLLYGDSNAQCMTPQSDCFQGLLERSGLGETHMLVNYGVGGYGLDQIYLMMRSSLDHFAGLDPIVIVSFLIDDDLERSALPFRCWPKPRFYVRDAALIEPEPVQTDTLQYLADNPPAIRSYLQRLLTFGRMPTEGRPLTDGAALAERKELNRALLEAIQSELEARSLEHFFFLFYLESGMRRSGAASWSEDVVLEFLQAGGAPSVSMREFIDALCGPPWTCLQQFVGAADSPLRGHLNAAGNRLSFEAMQQGIEGRYRDFDFDRARAGIEELLPESQQLEMLSILGRTAKIHSRAFHTCWRYEEFGSPPQHALLGLRAGSNAPTRVELDVRGDLRRLVAEVRGASIGDSACESSMLRLRIRLDQGDWREERFELGTPARQLQIDLTGGDVLTLQVEYDGSDPQCAWLALEGLRLH